METLAADMKKLVDWVWRNMPESVKCHGAGENPATLRKERSD